MEEVKVKDWLISALVGLVVTPFAIGTDIAQILNKLRK